MYRPAGTTPPRPWAPLSDDEWGALRPYVLHRATPGGRQVGDLRARMDAVFHMACRGYHVPWREVPDVYGKPDTVSRFFRRMTHAGLWHALLKSLAHPDLWEGHPLRRIEHYVVRACRRAARLGGLRLLFLIRELGRTSALNAPPWLLPDRRLSEHVWSLPILPPDLVWGRRGFRGKVRRWLRMLRALHRMAGGRLRIPRSLRLSWP